MKRLMLLLGAWPALALTPGTAAGAAPFQSDGMGPIRDVTAHWRAYQPATVFCIKPDVMQFTPGGTGATATGQDRACRRSGFPASATGLVKIRIRTPLLCRSCRRLFIDFSKIPAHNVGSSYYAHGHVYYRPATANFTYTIDPIAHSPNTKNFTNDKLLSPSGSLQEKVIAALDLRFQAYVSDTAHFIHNAIQGPYYIGPWYLNRRGHRIEGVYLDLNLARATKYPSVQLNEVGYADGFNSGRMCPNDDDLLYGGCVDWMGFSSSSVDPFAG
jgi:hypothetical protein